MKRAIFLLPLAFIVEITHAGVFSSEDLSQAYPYLNQLRLRAGMTAFSQNALLEKAAFNHANYLADNFLNGHNESEGISGFTGVQPKDRAHFAGYRSSGVSENVSSGDSNSIDSIDGLMGAIYHRFGFLNFINDEVGIGIASVSEPNPRSVYVYNMGNSKLNALCNGPAFSGVGRYYFNVCEPDIHISATDFENVEMLAQGNNPNIVLWPANGDNDVPPAFFEEDPDPLPDYSVSGYPISIQFNPLAFTDVNVTKFKLYREQDNHEVQSTRLLMENTDPNGKLSPLEYALFPLERLEWDTSYRVEAKYTANSGTDTLIWSFKTRGLGNLPLYTIKGEGEVISISQNSPAFAVYIPPTARFPKITEIRSSYFAGMTVDFEFIDGNTLWMNVSGNVAQEANFNFSGGRHFVVKITEVCEPATLSSDLKLHIPTLHYTPSPAEAPIVLWINLAIMDKEKLQFQILDYDKVDNAIWTCETATLSPDLQMHIPNLHYIPSPEQTLLFKADLEFVDNLLFQVISYSIN